MLPTSAQATLGAAMAVNRDEFFAQLEKLTDQEIEQRLPLFNREQLLLVQQYVDQRSETPQGRVSEPRQAPPRESERNSDTRSAALAALLAARKATFIAAAALILSIGAMLTAIVAGVMAYLTVRN